MITVSANTIYPQQERILIFIKEYIKKYHRPPRLREIANAFNLSAISTVHQHLTSLEKRGFIKRDAKSKNLEILDKEIDLTDTREVPILGYIAAGKPLEAVEEKDNFIPLPKKMFAKKEIYALKVKGDSMIDAHIMDGDTIIVENKTSADQGQIVVALLEDYTATLKIYTTQKFGNIKRIVLKPMNEKYKPIITDTVYVQGILLGVIRTY